MCEVLTKALNILPKYLISSTVQQNIVVQNDDKYLNVTLTFWVASVQNAVLQVVYEMLGY